MDLIQLPTTTTEHPEERLSVIYLKQQGYLFDSLVDAYADLDETPIEDNFLLYLSGNDYQHRLTHMEQDRLEFLHLVCPDILSCFDAITRDLSYQLAVFSQRLFPITTIHFYDKYSTIISTRLRIEGFGRADQRNTPQLFKDYCANEWHRYRLQLEGS